MEKLTEKRKNQIKKLSDPPSDPAEADYWHYQKHMLDMINAISGKTRTWEQVEFEAQATLDMFLGNDNIKH